MVFERDSFISANHNHYLDVNRIRDLILGSNVDHLRCNGVYLGLWRTDPDAGGSSDDSYTPQNKPASDVMKALFMGR